MTPETPQQQVTKQPRRRLNVSTVDGVVVVVTAALTVPHLPQVMDGDWLVNLILFQQLWVIAATIAHRPAQGPARLSPVDWLVLWLGVLLPIAMFPTAPGPLIQVGAFVTLVGLSLVVLSLVSLGRSFGFEPANRGVQVMGMYRLVRHPIYLSYFVRSTGFLIAYPSAVNAAIFALWVVVQIRRITLEEQLEEQLLQDDAQYRHYAERVRYRLVPGVW